jgi:hypothetical protein
MVEPGDELVAFTSELKSAESRTTGRRSASSRSPVVTGLMAPVELTVATIGPRSILASRYDGSAVLAEKSVT